MKGAGDRYIYNNLFLDVRGKMQDVLGKKGIQIQNQKNSIASILIIIKV